MQAKIKPKTYGPLRVHAGTDTTFAFETEAGNRGRAGATATAEALSPSDLVLASLASCIAISMRMAAEQMALTLGALDLSVIAIKATDPPNRFGRFEVIVKTGAAVAVGAVDELVARTKGICTISNTLGAEVVVRLNP
jgi:uncharacterized OsmC-like protein